MGIYVQEEVRQVNVTFSGPWPSITLPINVIKHGSLVTLLLPTTLKRVQNASTYIRATLPSDLLPTDQTAGHTQVTSGVDAGAGPNDILITIKVHPSNVQKDNLTIGSGFLSPTGAFSGTGIAGPNGVHVTYSLV